MSRAYNDNIMYEAEHFKISHERKRIKNVQGKRKKKYKRREKGGREYVGNVKIFISCGLIRNSVHVYSTYFKFEKKKLRFPGWLISQGVSEKSN